MPGKLLSEKSEHKVQVPVIHKTVIYKTENTFWQKAFSCLCLINTMAIIFLCIPVDNQRITCTCPADATLNNNGNNLELVKSYQTGIPNHRQKRSEMVTINS